MSRARPRWVPAVAAVAAATLVTPAVARAQFCPSYTASSLHNDNNCGVEAVNGADPSLAEWNDIFDLVSKGPSAWGAQGPTAPLIGAGCGKPSPLVQVEPHFPCELLKAIAQQESGWTQFCVPTTPSDQVGGPSRTIISFDCGYGVGQVTSGMHAGESPSFDPQRVAAEPTYNLATGTRILAGKWNATNCVGDNQPDVLEHWYTSAWAYNGLAYVNNPNNPNYDPGRGSWNPAVGGAAPYQEKVFGRMETPYGAWWDGTPVAYPNPADIGGGAVPPELPDPSCASPTDCASTRPLHTSACLGAGGAGGAGGGAGGAAAAGSGGAPGGAGGAGAAGTGAAGTGAAGTGAGGAGAGSNLVGVHEGGGGAGCACSAHQVDGGAASGSAAALARLMGAGLLARLRRRRR